MQPSPIRLTFRPVRPSRVYSIPTPLPQMATPSGPAHAGRRALLSASHAALKATDGRRGRHRPGDAPSVLSAAEHLSQDLTGVVGFLLAVFGSEHSDQALHV